MDQQHESQSPSAKIATSVVQILHEYTGRARGKDGITEDMVTILLADTLANGERTLSTRPLESGPPAPPRLPARHARRPRRNRRRGADRKVIAFMSQNHIDPDLAVEVFILGPVDPA